MNKIDTNDIVKRANPRDQFILKQNCQTKSRPHCITLVQLTARKQRSEKLFIYRTLKQTQRNAIIIWIIYHHRPFHKCNQIKNIP
ncbi:MAG: hypothetical protein WBP31_13255, partial [Chitinophagales bacterium]